jgi:hypothetical protein
MGLSSQVDQRVTLHGTARNAHQGAVLLMEDRTPVYIAGLEGWNGAFDLKQVAVTGTLRHRNIAPNAEVDEDGAVSHGMAGATFVVEDATWSLEAS